MIDEKGEPTVTPTGYYFDENPGKIYISTFRNYKKVNNIMRRNVISYCVDDPHPPYNEVRGKGKVESLTTSVRIYT